MGEKLEQLQATQVPDESQASIPEEIASAVAGAVEEPEASSKDTAEMPVSGSDLPAESDKGSSFEEDNRFDGSWESHASGEHMATISGHKLLSVDGEVQELQRTSATAFSFEMYGEAFSAELQADGRLVWSDGDIWVRKAAAHSQAEAAPCAKSASEAPAADHIFDGYWINSEGE